MTDEERTVSQFESEFAAEQRLTDRTVNEVARQFGVGSGREDALYIEMGTLREIVEATLREARLIR